MIYLNKILNQIKTNIKTYLSAAYVNQKETFKKNYKTLQYWTNIFYKLTLIPLFILITALLVLTIECLTVRLTSKVQRIYRFKDWYSKYFFNGQYSEKLDNGIAKIINKIEFENIKNTYSPIFGDSITEYAYQYMYSGYIQELTVKIINFTVNFKNKLIKTVEGYFPNYLHWLSLEDNSAYWCLRSSKHIFIEGIVDNNNKKPSLFSAPIQEFKEKIDIVYPLNTFKSIVENLKYGYISDESALWLYRFKLSGFYSNFSIYCDSFYNIFEDFSFWFTSISSWTSNLLFYRKNKQQYLTDVGFEGFREFNENKNFYQNFNNYFLEHKNNNDFSTYSSYFNKFKIIVDRNYFNEERNIEIFSNPSELYDLVNKPHTGIFNNNLSLLTKDIYNNKLATRTLYSDFYKFNLKNGFFNPNDANKLFFLNGDKEKEIAFFSKFEKYKIEYAGSKKKIENSQELFSNYPEYEIFLSSFSKDNRMLDVIDTLSSSFISNGWYDFVNPASLEYRGIYELYHFVMFKLLFIFLLLIIVSVFLLYRATTTMYSHDIKDMLARGSSKSMLYSFLLVCNFNINIGKKNKLDLKHIKNMYKHYELKHIIYNDKNISKINNVFMPVTFWVYFSTLEFVWTLIPCIILLFISIPSFTLALALDETHKPSIWIKVIGNQWYWIYEYSTYDENIVIYSNIVYGSDLEYNSLRLLKPDLSITIINNKFTRFLVTSSDVIHSWAVPALGIKIDACPGRINSISILPTREGVYYGQCSEICGVNHAFMPIAVEVIS